MKTRTSAARDMNGAVSLEPGESNGETSFMNGQSNADKEHKIKKFKRSNGGKTKQRNNNKVPRIEISPVGDDPHCDVYTQNMTSTTSFDSVTSSESHGRAESPIWRMRDSFRIRNELEEKKRCKLQNSPPGVDTVANNLNSDDNHDLKAVNKEQCGALHTRSKENGLKPGKKLPSSCPKQVALLERRQMVVEWQTIAAVVDRLLFWLFLFGTIAAYVIILFLIPGMKPDYSAQENMAPAAELNRNSAVYHIDPDLQAMIFQQE